MKLLPAHVIFSLFVTERGYACARCMHAGLTRPIMSTRTSRSYMYLHFQTNNRKCKPTYISRSLTSCICIHRKNIAINPTDWHAWHTLEATFFRRLQCVRTVRRNRVIRAYRFNRSALDETGCPNSVARNIVSTSLELTKQHQSKADRKRISSWFSSSKSIPNASANSELYAPWSQSTS